LADLEKLRTACAIGPSVCVEGAVVLATVKDEPLRGGLTAILDRRCARRHGEAQVGTTGWPF
jgi:hypothetical protein